MPSKAVHQINYVVTEDKPVTLHVLITMSSRGFTPLTSLQTIARPRAGLIGFNRQLRQRTAYLEPLSMPMCFEYNQTYAEMLTLRPCEKE